MKVLLTILLGFIFLTIILSSCTNDVPDLILGSSVSESELTSVLENPSLDEIMNPQTTEEIVIDSFLNAFFKGEITDASHLLTEGMQAVEPSVYKDYKDFIFDAVGEYLKYDITEVQDTTDFFIYFVTSKHTNGNANLKIYLSYDLKATGFHINDLEMEIPFVELPEGVVEIDIVVNMNEQFALSGKLTYPEKLTDSIPAVIIVHGSGPSDMDGTQFYNKPYRDFAYKLAEQGIAVLRYDKRTFVYSHEINVQELTVFEETIDDAIAAKTVLIEQGMLEINNIFILGHSMGGMLAPRIVNDGGFDGTIILAGSPRSIGQIAYDQYANNIVSSLEEGNISQETAEMLFAENNDIFESYKNLSLLSENELRNTMLYGYPGLFLKSIIDSVPIPYIEKNSTGVLILHGDRDFQASTDQDFKLFEKIVGGLPHVETVLYEDLNHNFMKAQTHFRSNHEYMIPGRVAQNVIDDIALWIFNQIS